MRGKGLMTFWGGSSFCPFKDMLQIFKLDYIQGPGHSRARVSSDVLDTLGGPPTQ